MGTQKRHDPYRKTRTTKIINSVIDSDALALCVRDSEGTVVVQNESCEHVCGDQVGKNCEKCVHEAVISPMSLQKADRISGINSQSATFETEQGQLKFFIPQAQAVESIEDALKKVDLTEAEEKVAQLLILGHSNAEILDKLRIKKNTLKTHLNHLYQKAPFLKKARQEFTS